MKIAITAFMGENRAAHPLSLPDGVSQISLNQNPVRGDLRPWKAPSTVATVPSGRNTIYRMGRDTASDSLYWLSWTGIVHAVRATIADDTTERTYYTGDGVPKVTDNTLALATAPYPTAFRLLGVPAPTSQLTLVANSGVSATTQTRYYVYTYVTDKGEESAQSPVSAALTCKTDDAVDISNIASPPAGAYGITRVRIYRTQSGVTNETEFFFLREIASGVATSTDDKRTLAEVLVSATWLTPPAGLTNLTAMWNGMMAGISGKSVRVCEAYKPYAWPASYEILPPDATPVALKVFGQTMLVLTTGKPRLVSGGSPDSLDDQPVEWNEACVSARSAVSFGHGVVWACPDGLAYLGSGGPRMITNGIMTKEDWRAIKPETIVGSMYEGAYLGMYTVGGVTKGFMIDPMNPRGMLFTDIPATAFYFDELQDQLYLLDGTNIKTWNTGAPVTVTARSKRFRLQRPTAFACAQVLADGYPVNFVIDAVNLPADGVSKMVALQPAVYTAPSTTTLRYTKSVSDRKPFRLPRGILVNEIEVELSGTSAVQGVSVAQSHAELAQ